MILSELQRLRAIRDSCYITKRALLHLSEDDRLDDPLSDLKDAVGEMETYSTLLV